MNNKYLQQKHAILCIHFLTCSLLNRGFLANFEGKMPFTKIKSCLIAPNKQEFEVGMVVVGLVPTNERQQRSLQRAHTISLQKQNLFLLQYFNFNFHPVRN